MKSRVAKLATIISLTALVLALAGSNVAITTSAAQGKGKAKQSQGQKLYLSHCASCHGDDGKGNGPVASSLKSSVGDLTQIKKVEGKFPVKELKGTISGTYLVQVHGKREMPVWSNVLTNKQIDDLVKYLGSIQK
ncbi:MAG: cytochrome c [Acidobacteria bacterium]|nr:cytochrome c [Acidobacteriota bacterium]